MSITDWIIELQSTEAYKAGYQAYERGKHLIVPIEYDSERDAWTLGWNDAWTDNNAV